ncbi:SDR family oxidoreductase [Taibaiella chishuiensis]|uniref:NAD(P)-dependent dehydrogenase (Short-subunit alcohol dehydrogenase family) n=1 Tax=Taibaiella chishuiensis TaxID=1434707 RepID=A0A2P8DA06_9BACT|nr:SDR family oxidoreductase [Taibaiella chishuiensis]PSK94043.1 NAD(P)-dependent dehydrogenase (short-subunit alcohol dehydrogenase family) [Taibaiella chishuiensis]
MATTQKTALITGANKGIGLETARQLALQGYYSYLGCRDKERAEAAKAGLQAAGIDNVDYLLFDVTDAASLAAAAQELERRAGSLDILVNNAGISGIMPQPSSTVSMDNMRQVFETNFFGVVQTTQYFLPLLHKSAQPRIVNVSSDLGSLTLNHDPSWPFYDLKLAAYNASKTALNAYTVTLAHELKQTAFKVNAVNPGFTATDMNQHQGIIGVEEAAAVVIRYALLDAEGPTGLFFSDYGATPW